MIFILRRLWVPILHNVLIYDQTRGVTFFFDSEIGECCDNIIQCSVFRQKKSRLDMNAKYAYLVRYSEQFSRLVPMFNWFSHIANEQDAHF